MIPARRPPAVSSTADPAPPPYLARRHCLPFQETYHGNSVNGEISRSITIACHRKRVLARGRNRDQFTAGKGFDEPLTSAARLLPSLRERFSSHGGAGAIMKTWFGTAVIAVLMTSAATAQETSDEAARKARIAAITTQIVALEAQIQQLGTATNSAPAAAPSTPPTNQELAEALEALDQKLRILERKLELEAEASAAKAQTTAVLGATGDGFTIKSPDNAFLLRLRGLVHADGRFYGDDTTGNPTDTFIMRRVRPILEATMFSFVDARIMPDFGGGTTVLQDAYIVARFFPQFRVRAGKFKPPVGLERLASASDILFVERALPTGLVPNRDLGVPDRRRPLQDAAPLSGRRLQRRDRRRQRRPRRPSRQGLRRARVRHAVQGTRRAARGRRLRRGRQRWRDHRGARDARAHDLPDSGTAGVLPLPHGHDPRRHHPRQRRSAPNLAAGLVLPRPSRRHR